MAGVPAGNPKFQVVPDSAAEFEAAFPDGELGAEVVQAELRPEFESLKGKVAEATLAKLALIGTEDAMCELVGESGRRKSEPLGWMVPDFAECAVKRLREGGIIRCKITNEKGEKLFLAFEADVPAGVEPVSGLERVLEQMAEKLERVELAQKLGGGGSGSDERFRNFQEKLMERAFAELTSDPFERLEKASKMTARMRELGGAKGDSVVEIMKQAKELAPDAMEFMRMAKAMRKGKEQAVIDVPVSGEVPAGEDPFAGAAKA